MSTPLTVTAACPAPTGVFGVPYSFSITVSGGQAPYSWELSGSGLPPGLTLSGSTGLISGTPTRAGVFSVAVFVFDSLQHNATYSCQMVINDFQITATCPAPGGTVGVSYSFSITVEGTAAVTWALASGPLPPGLSLNTGTGVISGVPTVAGIYPISVTVSLGGTFTAPITQIYSCSIIIAPPPLQITSGCPASPAPLGAAISPLTLTATGGSGNYIWSIQPNLPAGLTLNGSVISGTPTAAGMFNFTIQVTSGTTAPASIACSLTVSIPTLQLTSTCPGNGTVGVAYGPYVLTATGGLGAGTYTFSVQGNLPPGVGLSGNTISGTPTTAGNYLFTITVASGQQTANSTGCSITIAPAPLHVTASCPAAPLTVGSPVSIPLTVTGGQPPYSYTLSGASWLAINTSGATPAVSGTPTANNTGLFAISVTVTDSAKASALFQCNLTVNPAPALQISGSCPTNPITTGSPIQTISVTAIGGVPPYTWALTGNSGLSLAATQGATDSITGNAPSSAGSYSFTLTLSDSANSKAATLSCTLNVQIPPLQITGTCPASALNLPLSLSVPLTATGGQVPYAWTLAGPSWISLSSATGATTTVANNAVPNAPGAFSFSVTLSDNASSTPAVFSCNSSINAPAVPAVAVTGLTLQPSLLQTAPAGLQLSSAPLLTLTGTVTLSFVPNAFGITDNPQVYFNGGSRTASFTIAPGQTSFTLPSVQQGTDAGTIQLVVTDLKQGGVEVLSTPPPSTGLVIPREAPVVANTDVSFANETANGFDVLINGYSTPRDMVSVTLTFAAAAGAKLSGTTSFTVSLSSLFSQFYSTAASQLVGSQFQNLDVPVSVTGDKTAIGSVTVMLTNSAGNSPAITLTR